jgi:hypothetical protein
MERTYWARSGKVILRVPATKEEPWARETKGGNAMKIHGIKKLCSATKDLAPAGYLPKYKIQVHINTETGELTWADVTGNGFIQYDNPAWRFVMNIDHPATMRELTERITEKLEYWNAE